MLKAKIRKAERLFVDAGTAGSGPVGGWIDGPVAAHRTLKTPRAPGVGSAQFHTPAYL
jgi:hypothetical protein